MSDNSHRQIIELVRREIKKSVEIITDIARRVYRKSAQMSYTLFGMSAEGV